MYDVGVAVFRVGYFWEVGQAVFRVVTSVVGVDLSSLLGLKLVVAEQVRFYGPAPCFSSPLSVAAYAGYSQSLCIAVEWAWRSIVVFAQAPQRLSLLPSLSAA